MGCGVLRLGQQYSYLVKIVLSKFIVYMQIFNVFFVVSDFLGSCYKIYEFFVFLCYVNFIFELGFGNLRYRNYIVFVDVSIIDFVRVFF